LFVCIGVEALPFGNDMAWREEKKKKKEITEEAKEKKETP
jgi:hypothetical protein